LQVIDVQGRAAVFNLNDMVGTQVALAMRPRAWHISQNGLRLSFIVRTAFQLGEW